VADRGKVIARVGRGGSAHEVDRERIFVVQRAYVDVHVLDGRAESEGFGLARKDGKKLPRGLTRGAGPRRRDAIAAKALGSVVRPGRRRPPRPEADPN
jgi:hypothetical protein